MDSIEAIRRIRGASPGTQVVMLTSFVDEKRVRGAIEAGAVAYLMKDVLRDELLRAIRNAREGRATLAIREGLISVDEDQCPEAELVKLL